MFSRYRDRDVSCRTYRDVRPSGRSRIFTLVERLVMVKPCYSFIVAVRCGNFIIVSVSRVESEISRSFWRPFPASRQSTVALFLLGEFRTYTEKPAIEQCCPFRSLASSWIKENAGTFFLGNAVVVTSSTRSSSLARNAVGWILAPTSNNNFNLLVSYYKLKRAAASVLKKVPPR
jgi:hypothetical protein